jgi:hypothetical protein
VISLLQALPSEGSRNENVFSQVALIPRCKEKDRKSDFHQQNGFYEEGSGNAKEARTVLVPTHVSVDWKVPVPAGRPLIVI